jgi:hypothetical protein
MSRNHVAGRVPLAGAAPGAAAARPNFTSSLEAFGTVMMER